MRSQSKRKSYPPPSSPKLTPPPQFLPLPTPSKEQPATCHLFLFHPGTLPLTMFVRDVQFDKQMHVASRKLFRADFARIYFREVSEVSIYVLSLVIQEMVNIVAINSTPFVYKRGITQTLCKLVARCSAFHSLAFHLTEPSVLPCISKRQIEQVKLSYTYFSRFR